VRALVVLSILVASVGAVGVVADSSRASAQQDDEGSLVALDPTTGTQQWRVPSPGQFDLEDVSESVVMGRGFSCSADHFEYVAYGASDGKRLWHAPAPVSLAGPQGADSLASGSGRTAVVVVRTPGHLEGRDAKAGTVRWRRKVAHSAEAAASGVGVLVSTGNRIGDTPRLQLVDRKTGAIVWTKPFPAPTSSVSGVLGSTAAIVSVYIENRFDHAEVLDLRSGKLQWRSDRTLLPIDSAVVVSFAPYTIAPNPPASRAPRGHAVDDGRVLWDAEDETGVLAAPGFFGFWRDTTPFGGSPSGVFSAADPRTGAVHWSRTMQSPPLVSERLVVTNPSPGAFEALAADTGAMQWQQSVRLGASEHIGSAVVGRSVYAAVNCPEPSH
jgi:outer membrane protein assembly factor BamB